MIQEIRALFPRYPTRRAVTLPALHIVHQKLRHVPPRAVVEIAELLGLAPAEVQDTLSFYGFFKQDRPHGRTRLWVCRSISCHLRGAASLLEHLCDRTGLKPGETSADGRITLEHAECLGACEYAPCILANEELWRQVTPEDADRLLRSLR
jgi:NADH-quinone oxidoreductase subunit E